MKKTILCGIAATLFAANTLTAQTVKSYQSGVATDYNVSALTDRCLENADSVILSGSWGNADFSKLRNALAEIQNLKLKAANLSAVTFSENITTGMVQLFKSCQKLEKVVMPTNPGNASVSLEGTFSWCYALSTVDLSTISNITSLNRTFYGIGGLKKVTFSSTANNNALDMTETFCGCTRMTEIVNLDKLTNVTNWNSTFDRCEELVEIRIGSAVNGLTSAQSENTFNDCKKISVYLPQSTTTLPENWQQYSIFMFPISAVELTGNASWKNSYEPIILPQMTLTPTYAAVTEKVIRLSNDNFKTYTQIAVNESVDEDFVGYQVKMGVKNAKTADFVFSNAVMLVSAPKVWVRLNQSTMFDLWSWYSETPDYFASQGTESDTIRVTGYWTVSDLEYLKTGINKKSELKNKLVKIDMSGASFGEGETDAFRSLFKEYPNLETVIWPKAQVNTKISLDETFRYCRKLETVDNLQNLNNITKLHSTFVACNVKSLQFSDSVNNNPISLNYVVAICYNLQTIKNIDKFTNVTNWYDAFYNCGKIDTVYIGSDPNGLSEDKTEYAFSDCNAVKVMPWGVTTLPDNWQNYNNFVMPFSKIFYSGVPRISTKGGVMLMPDCKVEPSNVIATDFVYQLSNDDFATYTTHKQSDKLTGNYVGWKVRIGAKNARMTDYLFADTVLTVAQAAEFVSYTDGEATKVQMADVKKFVFGESDSIFVTGTLTQADIDKLYDNAIKYEYQSGGSTYTVTSTRLLKFDMSKAVFSGVHTLLLFHSNYDYMPLDSKLQTIILPETVYNDSISISNTFAFYSYLTTIKNLENLTNITNLKSTFAGCPNIAEIHLGTDPNRLDSLDLIGTFTECNAFKYLPDTVDDIPGAWRDFNNFVLPIKSAKLKGTIKFLQEAGILAIADSNIVYTPSYVGATDVKWQFSNDGFASNIIDYKPGIKLEGDLSTYKIRCAVKNERMKDYVYSTNSIAVEPMTAAIASYYNGKLTVIEADKLLNRQLEDKCDSMVMYGSWTNSDILKLSRATKYMEGYVCGANDRLQSVDMSIVKFVNDTVYLDHFLGLCTELRYVRCPVQPVHNKVDLGSMFSHDSKLERVDNFENFVNVINFYYTFENNTSLREIHIGTDPNTLYSYYLERTFVECEQALKYLPDGVTELPDEWRYSDFRYKPANFVIPITSVSAYFSEKSDNVKYNYYCYIYSGNAISLEIDEINRNPYCAYVSDTIFEISFDDFATFKTLESLENIAIPEGTMSFKLRVGLKNPLGTYYSEGILFEDKSAGIENEKDIPFAVYPNPATETIIVNVGEQTTEVQIFNALGTLVHSQEATGATAIDIAALPQGTYFVKVGSAVGKFVKD